MKSFIVLHSFSASISSIYDVFISYNWAIIDQVAKFDGKTEKKTGLRICRDVRDLTNSSNPLTAQLSVAIRKSNLIVCFITKQYCQSHNCNLEVDWANTLKKPLVVVMIEKLDSNEEISVTGFNYNSGIPFIIKYLKTPYRYLQLNLLLIHFRSSQSPCTRINCYENGNNWVESKFTEINEAIIKVRKNKKSLFILI